MKNFKEEKNFSEQNLFEEIVKDVANNYNFTRSQLQKVHDIEEDLNKLEEQRAVLKACGEILAEQNIQPRSKMTLEDDEGTQMVQIDTGSGRQKNRGPRKPTTDIDNEISTMMLETQLKVVAGVVKDADTYKLARLTFRASRGKIALYTKSAGKIYTRSQEDSNEPMSVYLMVF